MPGTKPSILVGRQVRTAVDGDEFLTSWQLAQYVDGDIVGCPGPVHQAVLGPTDDGSGGTAIVSATIRIPAPGPLEQGGLQVLLLSMVANSETFPPAR